MSRRFVFMGLMPYIWAEPLRVVIDALKKSKTYQELADNLPDVELIR